MASGTATETTVGGGLDIVPALVLVLHAFGGSPEKFWYRWLASELGGHAEVDVMKMTDPRNPTIDNWCGDLKRRIARCADDCGQRELYLVGHSVGCQAIVRFLARPYCSELLASSKLRLCGCLCVAAWFEVVDPWDTIDVWCRTPIDCNLARRVLDEAGCPLFVLLSDNDKYTPEYGANAKAWSDRLGAESRIISNRSHFGGKKQPEVLSAALNMLQRVLPPTTPSTQVAPLISSTGVEQLPTDLLAVVLGHLDAYSLCSAEQVNTGWHAAARGDMSMAGRGGWSVVLVRDYPAVPEAQGATSQLMYRMACLQRQCIRCHKQYRVGHNTASACGFHPGVIISGHRDNGMRARWTCCGKWGPTRAGGNTELLASEGFCSFTRHLGSLSSLNTPEDVGACGIPEKGTSSKDGQPQRIVHDASGTASNRSFVACPGGDEWQGEAANVVRPSLVEEMMHARSVAASQSVSWLGCGE